jgi:DNA repair exonuclease SbcCD ATPase subunit
MDDHKEKYQALQRIYEARLDHLTASVRKVYQSIKADEVGLAVQNAPGMETFFKAHVSEMVETELSEERESFLNRLADKISSDQVELAASQRRVRELESLVESLSERENMANSTVESLRNHVHSIESNSVAALREATLKCQSVASENARLKTELSVLNHEYDTLTNKAKETNENVIRMQAQVETLSTKNQALIEQLTSCQQLFSEEKRKYATLHAESKVCAICIVYFITHHQCSMHHTQVQHEISFYSLFLIPYYYYYITNGVQVMRERQSQVEARNSDYRHQLKYLQKQLSDVSCYFTYVSGCPLKYIER